VLLKRFLLHTACAISRVLVLQLGYLLLHTLLDNGVFFALILEEFLRNIFVFVIVEERERRGLCRQKQNVDEDSEFTELNALG
jgi:Na+-driven multidrug efflux pump